MSNLTTNLRRYQRGDAVLAGLFALAILLAVLAIYAAYLAIYAAYLDAKEWEAFSKAHACKVVGQMDGSTATTVMPIVGGNGGVGVGISSTPGKTGFLCDDGVTYWRNK